MIKNKSKKAKVKAVTLPNYPVSLVKCRESDHDDYVEGIACGAFPPQVLNDEQQKRLNEFLKSYSSSDGVFFMKAEFVTHDEIHETIARGKRLLESDKREAKKRVAAALKAHKEAEKARKLKRLQRLEALASRAKSL